MYTNFEHLSQENMAELKTRYYQGEPVHLLLREYDLQISPASLYKMFPPEPVEEYGCQICDVNLVVDALPKSRIGSVQDKSLYYCPVCGRKPFLKNYGWISLPKLSDAQITEKRNRNLLRKSFCPGAL